ncbi:MAG: ABC transporter ATP-binding protein [Rhodothalassiaceae bacterium]
MRDGLVARNLGFGYGRARVLHSVDLEVARGEIVCLLGPSGCGKTTFLRIAAGLERPDEGEVLIGGRLVASRERHVPPEARRVGLVLQDYALFPHLDILANVGFGIMGRDAKAREAEALSLLESVGMAAHARSWPHLISGGEQQRVALARALAPRPDVMLMDEPFSGLDISLRADVRASAIATLRARAVPTLVVTHDPFEALEIADRIVLMRDGAVIQAGTPEEVYLHPVDAWAMRFFGKPNRLLGIVKGSAVETPFGRLAVPSGTAEGATVEILFRSSSIERASDGEGRPFHVEQARLLGPIRRTILRTDDWPETIRYDMPRHEKAEPGATLMLRARLEEFHIFPAEQPMVEQQGSS